MQRTQMDDPFFHKLSQLVMFFGSVHLLLCDLMELASVLTSDLQKTMSLCKIKILLKVVVTIPKLLYISKKCLLYIPWKHQQVLEVSKETQIREILQVDIYTNIFPVVSPVGIAYLFMWRL